MEVFSKNVLKGALFLLTIYTLLLQFL